MSPIPVGAKGTFVLRVMPAHLLATYNPPPHALGRLGRFGDVPDTGYPPTQLFKLPLGCPNE